MHNESDAESSGFANGIAIKVTSIILAVLLVVYVGTTWLVGRTAQARVDVLVKQATEQLTGQLKLVERKSNPGFFRTTEDLTFTFDNPFYTAMLSKALPQFTIRNVISHGPIPGLRSIGIARIDTTLVMTDEQRKSLIELLGTDRPIEFVTKLGWSGSVDMDIDSPKIAFNLPNDEGKVEWKGLEADLHYSPGAKDMTMSAEMPGITVISKSDTFVIDNVAADVQLQERFETLYVGNETFTIDSIAYLKGSEPVTTIKGIRYVIDLNEKNEYFNVAVGVGADTFEFIAQNSLHSLKDFHFDFSVEHLHGPTLAGLTKTYQAYALAMQAAAAAALIPNPSTDPVDADANPDAPEHEALAQVSTSPAVEAKLTELKEQAVTLLQRTPILKINHVGYATANGDLKLIGSIQLNDVTLEDLEPTPNSQYLVNKVFASGEFSVAQSAIDHWSLGMAPEQAKQTFAQLEQEGFLKRTADRLESHLEFKEGKLTANGKPVGPQ